VLKAPLSPNQPSVHLTSRSTGTPCCPTT